VQWFQTNDLAGTKEDASNIAQKLIDAQLILSLSNDKVFSAGELN
jgi:hypothetical protein